jgi:mono/diheme cytochrome c family protein
MRSPPACSALVFVGIVAGAQAQTTGNPRQGLRLARIQCAECHVVTNERDSATNHLAPFFKQIANVPGMTSTALMVALRTSHRQMPNVIIANNDIRDVVAYILSLKTKASNSVE